MNRLWIGVGILVVLLIAGVVMLLVSWDFNAEFSDGLEQAGELALSGNWVAAEKKAAQSREKWERYRLFWASSTDHEPVEQMQNLFSQLEIYQRRQMEVDFAAVCRHLVNLAEAIDESHSLSWWSIL